MNTDSNRNNYKLKGDFAFKGFETYYFHFNAIERESSNILKFSVEYTIINPQLGKHSPIVPQKERGIVRPAYFKVVLNRYGENPISFTRYIGVKSTSIDNESFCIKSSECEVGKNYISGSIEKGDGEYAEWGIATDMQYSYSPEMKNSFVARFLNVDDWYWHAEGFMAQYRGLITVNGVIYDVVPNNSMGYADKIWGSEIPDTNIFIESRHLISSKNERRLMDSSFAGRGLDSFHRMSLCINYHGVIYEFNSGSRSLRTKSKVDYNVVDGKVVVKGKMINRRYACEFKVFTDQKMMLTNDVDSTDGLTGNVGILCGADGYGYIKLYDRRDDGLKLIDTIKVKDCAVGVR